MPSNGMMHCYHERRNGICTPVSRASPDFCSYSSSLGSLGVRVCGPDCFCVFPRCLRRLGILVDVPGFITGSTRSIGRAYICIRWARLLNSVHARRSPILSSHPHLGLITIPIYVLPFAVRFVLHCAALRWIAFFYFFAFVYGIVRCRRSPNIVFSHCKRYMNNVV